MDFQGILASDMKAAVLRIIKFLALLEVLEGQTTPTCQFGLLEPPRVNFRLLANFLGFRRGGIGVCAAVVLPTSSGNVCAAIVLRVAN